MDLPMTDRPAPRPQACTDCAHLAIVRAATGLFCMLFNEPLLDERAARTCLGFERVT